MELTFHDAGKAPLPPNEIQILALSAEPWSDGRRVGVEIEISPFQQRPNMHISIHDAQGHEVASVGAMQIRETQIAYTLHLRQPATTGQYRVLAHVAYADPDLGIVGQAETTFDLA